MPLLTWGEQGEWDGEEIGGEGVDNLETESVPP